MNEALSAMRRPETDQGSSSPRAIQYAVAGVVFGFAFPVIATVVKVSQLREPWNAINLLAVHGSEPLLWIIDTAPLFLGILAGFAGRRLDMQIETHGQMLEREQELSSIRTGLEQRFTERTAELERRSSLMRSLLHFTSEIAEVQDVPVLVNKAVDLIARHFEGYHANLFLIDATRKVAILHAASSKAGKDLLERGHRVEIGDGTIEGRVAERGKLYVSSMETRTLRGSLGDEEMPFTPSRITLPLVARGVVTGVLDIQSEQPQAFSQTEAEVLQLLADQVAASVENARLASESRAVGTQLEMLTAQQTQATWEEYLRDQRPAYQFTPAGIKATASMADHNDEGSLRVPLALRGTGIGWITLKRKGISTWREAERDLVQKVATRVALALDNSRLLAESRQRAAHEQTVNEISARFGRSLDVDTLLQTAARELAALPEVAEAAVFIKPVGKDEDRRTNPDQLAT